MRKSLIPPMPESFTDSTAWDAIHYEFSDSWARTGSHSVIDGAVMGWQRDNQERVIAAMNAKAEQCLALEVSKTKTGT